MLHITRGQARCEVSTGTIQKKAAVVAAFFAYTPMQDVAPRAVRIADAIDAMICTIHFRVSFFVIIDLLP